MHDREAVYQMLRDWIHTANPTAAAVCVDPETDLLKSRILESLQMVELVCSSSAGRVERFLPSIYILTVSGL